MHRNYELIVILSYESSDEEIDKQIEKIKEIITRKKGEVTNINKWGKRRLAYEIKKEKKGFYLLIQFACQPNSVKEIELDLKFLDKVERFITVSASEKNQIPIAEADLEMSEEAIL